MLRFAPNDIDRIVAQQLMMEREWYPTIVALASKRRKRQRQRPRLLMVKTAKARNGEIPSWMPPQRGIKSDETCADAAKRVLLEEVGIESAEVIDYRGHCRRAFGPGRKLTEEGWEDAVGRLMIYVHLELPEDIGELQPRDPSIAECTFADAGKYAELIRTCTAGKQALTCAAVLRSHIFSVLPPMAHA